jgi:hypothetical protein
MATLGQDIVDRWITHAKGMIAIGKKDPRLIAASLADEFPQEWATFKQESAIKQLTAMLRGVKDPLTGEHLFVTNRNEVVQLRLCPLPDLVKKRAHYLTVIGKHSARVREIEQVAWEVYGEDISDEHRFQVTV